MAHRAPMSLAAHLARLPGPRVRRGLYLRTVSLTDKLTGSPL
jgi:hypothetical protein